MNTQIHEVTILSSSSDGANRSMLNIYHKHAYALCMYMLIDD